MRPADYRSLKVIPRVSPMPIQSETFSFRMSKAEGAALRKRSREEKISRGKLVRRALASYSIVAETSQQSGFDRIKHIIGRIRGGPAKLSTHPKYLDHYGV
jgi:hypothetical protein